MAAFSDFILDIISLLNQNGLPADIEYPHKSVDFSRDSAFCLVGLQAVCADMPLPCDGGSAAPVTLDVRFRIHCDPRLGAAYLGNLLENTIIPALSDHFYDLRALRMDAPAFDKQIGRLVLNAVCTVHGTFSRVLADERSIDYGDRSRT